jgi:serine protease
MYKGSIAGDAGYQYITLINVNNTNPYYTPQQIAASRDPVTGSYSFSFSNVGDGEYYIVSGTDMDNDYVICDAGEACGTYPDVGSFTISGGNVSGIHFNTGYYVPSAAASLSTGSDRSLMIQRKASSGKQVPAP